MTVSAAVAAVEAAAVEPAAVEVAAAEATVEAKGDESTAGSRRSAKLDKDEQQQQQPQQLVDDPISDAAFFPSLEEQNRQLSEAKASLQHQQERRRQLQQQQQQQEAENESLETEATDEACCSYCGVSGCDILLRCASCDRFFCNSVSGAPRRSGVASHILHHIIKSKHREVCVCSSASGDTKLECFVCGVKNVLQLGMVVSEARGVVIIVCRDRCYAKGVLEDNGWDASQWQPLIDNKAFASWLVRPLTNAERAAMLPVSRLEMEQLEERWAQDGNATLADIRSEGSEPLVNCELLYPDAVSYQRVFAPLIAAEADIERRRRQEEVAVSSPSTICCSISRFQRLLVENSRSACVLRRCFPLDRRLLAPDSDVWGSAGVGELIVASTPLYASFCRRRLSRCTGRKHDSTKSSASLSWRTTDFQGKYPWGRNWSFRVGCHAP
ncbi:regulator of nonsense transcripts 1 [Cyclospora cayetanensis]|uniref:Regulator of nonsense transcripts 1 n=1 Tax=Cyclospora cayetanensis TaxID=88456 RepID=A0A6P6RWB5_9EIME|nr:regulator of nonsense transcripts 1 [Cyclospora cayetanensis]